MSENRERLRVNKIETKTQMHKTRKERTYERERAKRSRIIHQINSHSPLGRGETELW